MQWFSLLLRPYAMILVLFFRAVVSQADWDEFSPGSASGGGITLDRANPEEMSVAFDGEGRPVVVWNNLVGETSLVQALRWDGTKWSRIGSEMEIAPFPARVNRVLVDPTDNRLVVSLHQSRNYLLKFDGTAWVPWADSGIDDLYGLEVFTDIGFLPEGTPVALYQVLSYDEVNQFIHVRKWDGTQWVEFSPGSAAGRGIAESTTRAMRPQLAITRQGVIYALWRQDYLTHGNEALYLKKWDRSAWVENPLGSASGLGITGQPSSIYFRALTLDSSGQPIVIFQNLKTNSIHVVRLEGEVWTEWGESSTGGHALSAPGEEAGAAILVNNHGEHPVAIWIENESRALHAKRFNGNRWEPAGVGSDVGDGLGRMVDDYYDAAMRDDGLVVVAYVDAVTRNIYVKSFDSNTASETPTETPTAIPTVTPTVPPTPILTPPPMETPTPIPIPLPPILPVEENIETWFVLDGFGGVHSTNPNVPLPVLPYFINFNIARDLEPDPLGRGWYLLDGYGGIHTSSPDLPLPQNLPYFGMDIARNLEITATDQGLEFFLLDGFGTVHTSGQRFDYGSLPWFGFDIARDLEPDPETGGWFILDGFGVLHSSRRPVHEFPLIDEWTSAPNLRSIVRFDGNRSVLLDAYGGRHTSPQRPAHNLVDGLPEGFYFPGWEILWDVEVILRR